MAKYKCEKCGRQFTDSQSKSRKKVVGEENTFIENEFIPLCNVCGRKWMKAEKKKAWLGQALTAGWITQKELKQYSAKEMCERDLFMLIQKRKQENKTVREDLPLEQC